MNYLLPTSVFVQSVVATVNQVNLIPGLYRPFRILRREYIIV